MRTTVDSRRQTNDGNQHIAARHGGDERQVCLSGVADALGWRHVLETNDYEADPEYKRPDQRLIVCPDFLSKLGPVLATGNPGLDPDEKRWPGYEAIILDRESFACQPIIVPESDPRLAKWTETSGKSEEWMEEAKAITIAGHKQVLEYDPDVCNSESEAKYSDHGEELTAMYTSDMLDEFGNPILARAMMTREQADLLRRHGRPGGLAAVSGVG
jgi:hypothetical protein